MLRPPGFPVYRYLLGLGRPRDGLGSSTRPRATAIVKSLGWDRGSNSRRPGRRVPYYTIPIPSSKNYLFLLSHINKKKNDIIFTVRFCFRHIYRKSLSKGFVQDYQSGQKESNPDLLLVKSRSIQSIQPLAIKTNLIARHYFNNRTIHYDFKRSKPANIFRVMCQNCLCYQHNPLDQMFYIFSHSQKPTHS